jgi:hypothetical protein
MDSGGATAQPGPILITGVYRTGSTLLTRVLDQNPGLRVTYDRANFFRFYLDLAPEIMTSYKEILRRAQERFSSRWSAEVPIDRIESRLRQGGDITFAKVYDAFMRETFCGGDPNARWGEKTLLQWTNIPLFLGMFPGAKALHVHRDPRAILASQREITWEEPYRYLDAIFACLHSMRWVGEVGGALNSSVYKVVRYEDLIAAPEGFARDLCGFLEVKYVPEMIVPAGFKDDDGRPWKTNTAYADIDGEGFPSTAVNRWKQTLDTWEVGLLEGLLGDLLPQFGYEYSGVTLGPTELRTILGKIQATPLIQSRLHRWFETGEGVERYPSDPRDPQNWAKHTFR